MRGLFAAFARNVVFSNIVLMLIFLGGFVALTSMIRENFPELALDMISVAVPFPGANPEEVEEGITRKIEKAIEGLEGIKECTTYSAENLGSAAIVVKDGYDIKQVLNRVKTAVEAITTFPKDVLKPIVQDLTTHDPVILLSLQGNMDERRLKEWSERIREELMAIPIVTQVASFGTRQYEISVEVSEQKLQQHGLSFFLVSEAIRRSNINLSGGTLHTQGEEIRLRTMGRKYTGAELSNIIVKASPTGGIVTLGQVATIKDDFAENPVSALIDGKPAVLLAVLKAPGEDSLAIAEKVDEYLAKKQSQLPPGANLKIFYDNTSLLRDRIDLLIENGIQGLLIVFASLWIFMNGRLAFWVGMGIPVSISGALAMLWGMGETINMISLFGLIMVLGIVVDDAIVVSEAIYVHRTSGDPPLTAAINGTTEVGMPVISSVLTTVVAFVPLYFVKGIMGKMIAILPVVVVCCLLVSLLESLFLLPAHLSHLPDPNKKYIPPNAFMRLMQRIQETANRKMGFFVEWIYIPLLHKCIQYRYILFCTSISVLFITVGVLKSGLVKFEVFGDVDGFVIISTVEFPEGTPADITQSALKKMDEALLRLETKNKTRSGEPLLKSRLRLMGETMDGSSKKGTNVGSVEGILLDSEDRGIHYKDLLVQWEKEIGVLPGAKSIKFEGIGGGPMGTPIEVWLLGKDLDQLQAASKDLMDRLGKIDGVFQVRSDFSRGKNEMRLTLKPEATGLGLTVEDLATQVYSGYFGHEILRVQRGREDVAVKIRYEASARNNISDLYRMRIRTVDGRELPLISVANIHFEPGYSTITRSNGLRRIAVFADVDANRANANEVYQDLQKSFFPQLQSKYYGLKINLQGEDKMMKESFGSIEVSFPLAAVGIFVLIAATFRSYVQPILIMVTIPFGAVGAVFWHIVMGYDLTLMSILGIVAVAGIVVNDAIVLIERVNEYLAEGMPFFGSVILGAARRFRAIFLTTLSTICGLMPLIFETNFQAKFLIPMAISIAGGLMFATFLVVVQMPCLIAILNDLRLFYHRQQKGVWVPRNVVEPASERYREELEAPASPEDKAIILR